MVGFSKMKGEKMAYKLKALAVGMLGMSIIGSLALLINVFMVMFGTDVFVAVLGIVAGLYFCYIFGDLFLNVYNSKVKSDA